MIWVWVLLGIGVAGLVMVVCYAVWLWHKVSDVMAEVAVVTDRLGQVGDLLAQLDLTPLDAPFGAPSDGAADRSEGPDEIPGGRAVRFAADPYAADDLVAERETAVGSLSTTAPRHGRTGGSED